MKVVPSLLFTACPARECADTSARRREHFHVGSAKTSMFWKLAAASALAGLRESSFFD
ncbi:hypothetical protein [Shewanella atlantica]|uniref:hypothetical protein n=1 Tax=Shewanella atlantica TaxID=271099 RepID=UPI00163ADF36|nr:hypothetical protein [Shewanella atlantica]